MIYSGGQGGIRTHGTLRFAGFQDQSHRPLDHLSRETIWDLYDQIQDRQRRFFENPLKRSTLRFWVLWRRSERGRRKGLMGQVVRGLPLSRREVSNFAHARHDAFWRRLHDPCFARQGPFGHRAVEVGDVPIRHTRRTAILAPADMVLAQAPNEAFWIAPSSPRNKASNDGGRRVVSIRGGGCVDRLPRPLYGELGVNWILKRRLGCVR